MLAIFMHSRFVLCKRLGNTVAAFGWAAGGVALARIRIWVSINLGLGIPALLATLVRWTACVGPRRSRTCGRRQERVQQPHRIDYGPTTVSDVRPLGDALLTFGALGTTCSGAELSAELPLDRCGL
jgi:hypothetical protein